jgi:hypothetical protein
MNIGKRTRDMHFLLAVLLCLSISGASAQNFYRSDPPGATAGVLVGEGICGPSFPFNNLLKCSQSEQGPTAYPQVFDNDGYPNNPNGTGGIPLVSTIIENVALPTDYCNFYGTTPTLSYWEFRWKGTQGTNLAPGWKWQAPGNITVISGTNYVTNGAAEIDLYGGTSATAFVTPVIFTMAGCNLANLFSASGANNSVSGWRQGATYGAAVAGGANFSDFQLLACRPSYPGYNPATPCSAVEAAANAADAIGGGYAPDFINAIAHLHPGWLRPFLPNFGNLTSFKYRMRTTNFSYANARWDAASWAGQITCPNSGGNCTSDVLAATLGSGPPTDGLMVQGYLQAATLTKAPCLALNGGTCYPMSGSGQGSFANVTASVSDGGGACNGSSTYSGVAGTCMIESGSGLLVGAALYGCQATGVCLVPGTTIVSNPAPNIYVLSQSVLLPSTTVSMHGLNPAAINKNITASFDAALQIWQVVVGGGITDGPPVETLAALSNILNTNAWFSIPPYLVQDGSMQSYTSLFLSNLNPQLGLGLEYCNEEWNSAYDCYAYSFAFGNSYLGISISGDVNDDFYAFKAGLFFADAYAAAGNGNSRIYGILASQFYGANWSGYESTRFEGKDLCWSVSAPQNCPQANPVYQANVGVAYNNSPNRAVDYARIISAAPYTQGGLFTEAVQGGYVSSAFQILTSNYAGVATAADQWASGDTTDAYAAITADLEGSASQPLHCANTNFSLSNPINSVSGNGGPCNSINPNQIGTFTGTTSGSSTTVVVTNLTGKLYADPVNGSVIFGSGTGISNTPPTIFVGQVSGPTGGNGTYTASVPVSLAGVLVRYSNSWLQNWEQLTEDMNVTASRSVTGAFSMKFLPYEQAPQMTGPRVSDCNSIPSGSLNTSPKYYCLNVTGGNGLPSVAGYQVGDCLSYTGGGLTGFSYCLDTVGPDGTPLTGHIASPGSGGGGSVTAQLLTGGHGFNISADLTESGGAVTAVTLYSQVVAQMILAYNQTASFKATQTQLYAAQLAQPSTIGVAQSDYTGYLPNSNPWAMVYNNLYGLKFGSISAFCTANGGTGC